MCLFSRRPPPRVPHDEPVFAQPDFAAQYNAEQLGHQQDPVSWWSYIGSADFWENTLENWQSEFLAVGSMAILSVYLRQRGSPESKPVGAPHDATGLEG